MLSTLVQNKVYYKIFDKTNQESTHIYGKYKAENEAKIAEIEKNIKVVTAKLKCQKMLILNQVHGNNIIDADLIDNFNLEPEADAAVTTKSHLALAIQTADCVPVLLACSSGNVIGAAHCGWKSAKLDIIDKLVEMMRLKQAKEIVGVIGPSIQQYSYEVDQNFYDDFVKINQDNQKFFIPSKQENRFMFDLPDYVTTKLQQQGIYNINRYKDDTYSNEEQYPSYRRACHKGKHYRGNILSTIIISNKVGFAQ